MLRWLVRGTAAVLFLAAFLSLISAALWSTAGSDTAWIQCGGVALASELAHGGWQLWRA